MNILEIINKKKNKKSLTREEIYYFVENLTKEAKLITDYQATALLMAITINGLSMEETFYLTEAMLNSGNKLTIKTALDKLIIDKHSTGGIGDKVSLILSPIISALGYNVAKLSGKGLSYTGGTIDKLNAIGAKTDFNINDAVELMNKFGMFIMSQTSDIAPADKKIYALRDVSGTVESIPLIVSSILSKKLCINSDHLYLDVKVGTGAFFKTLKEAKLFCKYVLYVTKKFNKKTHIHLTNMNFPLGTHIGNKLEIIEAIKFLDQQEIDQDLENLIIDVASDLLVDTNKVTSKLEAIKQVKDLIASKQPLNILLEYLKTVGSNLDLMNWTEWFKPKYEYKIIANNTGYFSLKDCSNIGLVSLYLGAGRKTKQDLIDYDAGIILHKKHNQKIHKGDVLATLFSSNPIHNDVVDKFYDNLVISSSKLKKTKIILKKYNN